MATSRLTILIYHLFLDRPCGMLLARRIGPSRTLLPVAPLDIGPLTDVAAVYSILPPPLGHNPLSTEVAPADTIGLSKAKLIILASRQSCLTVPR